MINQIEEKILFENQSNNELGIMSKIALANDMTIKDVSALTKFNYAKLAQTDNKLNLSQSKISTKTVFGKTVLVITSKDGTRRDYWFNTTNSFKASKDIARIYSLPDKLVWKNILRNR